MQPMNLVSCFCILEKVIKMLHGHFVLVGKALTDLQILGYELHQNAFGGRALPRPAGEVCVCVNQPPRATQPVVLVIVSATARQGWTNRPL